MKTILAVWAWFNGKKSAYAGYVFGVAAALQYLHVRYGVNIPHADLIDKVLTDVGATLAGVGGLHKLYKVKRGAAEAEVVNG